MNWELKDYNELTKDELYEILMLRCEVFVAEQKCTEAEIDGKDRMCKHLFLRENGDIIACLRILPRGLSYDEPSIGRFAAKKECRGRGIGRDGMKRAIEYIFNEWNETAIRISGQAYLYDFYCSFGFKEVKGPYLEDKIPHYQFLLTK